MKDAACVSIRLFDLEYSPLEQEVSTSAHRCTIAGFMRFPEPVKSVLT